MKEVEMKKMEEEQEVAGMVEDPAKEVEKMSTSGVDAKIKVLAAALQVLEEGVECRLARLTELSPQPGELQKLWHLHGPMQKWIPESVLESGMVKSSDGGYSSYNPFQSKAGTSQAGFDLLEEKAVAVNVQIEGMRARMLRMMELVI